jgi:hypothetical protein
MCYITYISTTSARDLTPCGTDRISFRPLGSHDDDLTAAGLLAHEHKWFVCWMGGCSCGLRHYDPRWNPGDPEVFGEPEDWCPEDPEDVENTKHLYRVLASIVADGHTVDCLSVDVGSGDPWQIDEIAVELGVVGESAFRLLTGYRMELRRGP